MREAIALSMSEDVFRSSNPRVGCVIVDATGVPVGRGWHQGAGTAHAEVHALAQAGEHARGATAVVTLEPCAHTGRTGPCAQALIDAGIARVVYAVADPTAQAAGGGQALRDAGVEVVSGVLEEPARHANRAWLHWQQARRPLVTLKCAMSLDGRVADATGGPTRITGPQARSWAHGLRAEVDAIVVGTGTVLADDPQLTARHDDGSLRARQPLRVVMGTRAIPDSARILDGSAETVVIASHDLGELMEVLSQHDVLHALVEGGPTLEAALIDAGLADEAAWLVAPVVLGAGPVALPPLARQAGLAVRSVTVLGEDVLVEGGLDVHRDR